MTDQAPYTPQVHTVTITRSDFTAPAVLRVYERGDLVVSIPLSRKAVIGMIRDLAEVAQ